MRLWTLRFVCTGKDATAVLTHWYHHVALSPLYLQIGEVWFVMSCHPPGHLWSTWDIYFLTVVVLSSYPYARVVLSLVVSWAHAVSFPKENSADWRFIIGACISLTELSSIWEGDYMIGSLQCICEALALQLTSFCWIKLKRWHYAALGHYKLECDVL